MSSGAREMQIKPSSSRRRGASSLVFLDSRLRGNDEFYLIGAFLVSQAKVWP